MAIHSIRLHIMAWELSVCWSSMTLLSSLSTRSTVTGIGGRWRTDSSIARSSLFSSMPVLSCVREVSGWSGTAFIPSV